MIEIDYEFILIFKKPGRSEEVPREIKEKSKLTKEEWKELWPLVFWWSKADRA